MNLRCSNVTIPCRVFPKKKDNVVLEIFPASPEDVMPFSFSGPPSPVAVGNRDVKDPIVKELGKNGG